MKTSIIAAAIVLLLSPTASSFAQASQPTSRAGEAYVITQSYKTSEEGSDGSSGSSGGNDSFLERVIARRDGGVELEYDLPPDATPEDRARNWQLPARVFRVDGGRMQLLNSDQLEERLAGWLKAAKWNRSVCGRWMFTWTAFRIECDPQSILSRLEEMDLASQILRDGAAYLDARASSPGRLFRAEDSAKGTIFSATTKVDPEKVRLERAKTDVAVGELTQKSTSLEAALRARSKEQISGSISVAWETDDAGVARKRTKTITLETKRADGVVEKQTAIEIVERRRLGG